MLYSTTLTARLYLADIGMTIDWKDVDVVVLVVLVIGGVKVGPTFRCPCVVVIGCNCQMQELTKATALYTWKF
jgi:hypothetical protein